MICRALLSVSNKEGLEGFAKRLEAKGIEILSTGGTAKTLSQAGVRVTSVSDVTKFPECFGGRVKTMHPLLLGGVLFRREDASHKKEAEKLGIAPIDLVVINLYPFAETVKKGAAREEVIENIDVGGPTLLRSAAKNCSAVTVICDPNDYERVIDQIESAGETTPELRAELAAKAFLLTASYDAHITEYFSEGKNRGVLLTNGEALRYGENPHQWGKFYERSAVSGQGAAKSFQLLQGKELSYLNILDADAAVRLVQEFAEPTAACIKHANPSGVASNESIAVAFQRAYDADRLSAFGVIIALNRDCTEEIAQKIIDQQIFVEVVVAPGYEKGALEILKQKPKVRILERTTKNEQRKTDEVVYRSAFGGLLVQNEDSRIVVEKDLTCVTKKKPTPGQIKDLLFAWKVVKHAKSNAIVFAKDGVTLGIGCGQTSRIDATYLAAKRSGDYSKGAVMASDAFFPFSDAVEEASRHGIVAIIQPGGSIRDAEVFAKAEELGIAMVTTGVRAFRH